MKPKIVVLAPLLGLLALAALGYLVLPRVDTLRELIFPGGSGGSPTARVDRPEGENAAAGRAPLAGSTRTLKGLVRIPDACEGEDALSVYALAGGVTAEEGLRRIAEIPTTGSSAAVLGPTPVEADGSFALEVPAELERVHLLARGRFLFTTDPVTAAISPSPGDELVLHPRCGAALRGLVVLPGGPGTSAGELGGIEVRLSPILRGVVGREGEVRSTRTTPDGRFGFRAVPVPGTYELQLDPEEHAGMSVDLASLEPGVEAELELLLRDGGSIAGRVVDEAGAAVDGAIVSARVTAPSGRSDWGAREARTGPDGSFLLEHLPAETIVIRADHDRLLQSPALHVRTSEGGEENGVVITLQRGGTVAGTVTWPDGRPVEAAPVRVEFDAANQFGGIVRSLGASRGARGSAATDAQGHFEVTGLGSGPFCVCVQVEKENGGEAKGTLRWSTRLDGVDPDTLDLRLVLAEHTPVRGRVVDLAGAPVRDFRIDAVQIVQTGIGPLARDRRTLAFATENGRFELEGLEAGPWHLYATADAYGASEAVRLDLPAETEPEVELRLALAATVTGTVRTTSGAPVEGAVVRADAGGPEWMARASGEPLAPIATSREDGRFELAGLNPGTARLYARAEGFARGPATLVELEPGETRSGVEVLLRTGGTLTGEIFGAGARPASEAMVQLVSTSSFEIVHTESGEDGTFVAEHLDPGTWRVIVLPAQDRMEELVTGGGEHKSAVLGELKMELVEIEDGESTHVVFGAPPANPVLVRGRVLHDGRPVSGAEVVLVREGENVVQRLRRASTDGEGRFALTIDGGGSHLLEINRPLGGVGRQASIEFPVQIPEPTAERVHALELELPGGRISGVAVGPEGKPAAKARVTVMPRGTLPSTRFESHCTTEDLTGGDGSFDLDGLFPGEYVLAIGGMENAGLFGGVHARAPFGRSVQRVTLAKDEWIEHLDVELGPAATIRLRVLDDRGRPVASAALLARDERGDRLEDIAVAKSDDAGYCEYGGLAPGTYAFCAQRGDLASPWQAVTGLTAGEVRVITLHLEESTFLWIRTLDASGNGVPAKLRVVDEETGEGGYELQWMISLDGLTDGLREHGFSTSDRRFGPLPPGRYRIEATRGDETLSRRITLTGRRERKQTLRFED